MRTGGTYATKGEAEIRLTRVQADLAAGRDPGAAPEPVALACLRDVVIEARNKLAVGMATATLKNWARAIALLWARSATRLLGACAGRISRTGT